MAAYPLKNGWIGKRQVKEIDARELVGNPHSGRMTNGLTRAGHPRVHSIGPFPDDPFDRIFCHALFEHLSDPVRALSEARRMLKLSCQIGFRATEGC